VYDGERIVQARDGDSLGRTGTEGDRSESIDEDEQPGGLNPFRLFASASVRQSPKRYRAKAAMQFPGPGAATPLFGSANPGTSDRSAGMGDPGPLSLSAISAAVPRFGL
jgi:hypothetical protein